jgi:hypothetical protein
MKRLSTIMLLLVGTYLSSNAQFIGLSGGVSFATINSSMSNNIKSITGIQCGVFDEFTLSTSTKWLSIETGLMIQTKGSNINYNYYMYPLGGQSPIHVDVNNSTHLVYLDIPLTVKMYTTVGKPNLYFEAGPYIGFGLSGEQHDDSGHTRIITWSSTGETSNYDEYYKRFDGGILIGVGMKIEPIQFGLSYELGLVNMYPTMSGSKAYNRAFSMFIEFMIPLKEKSSKNLEIKNN